MSLTTPPITIFHNPACGTSRNTLALIRNSGAEPPEPPDPPLALTIAQIQGNGLLSPHNGKRVVTEGIVTAIKFNNGFFLQAANDDGDPATSDAVFVFTSSAPPATAAVGNRVRVTGTVEEYTPSSNPHQLAITEIVTPTVEVLETGLALPAAIELTAAELSPDALPGTLPAAGAADHRRAEKPSRSARTSSWLFCAPRAWRSTSARTSAGSAAPSALR